MLIVESHQIFLPVVWILLAVINTHIEQRNVSATFWEAHCHDVLEAGWSILETQYQRRYDLIPNLVATVQGAADFEKETLTAVTEARASAFNAMQAVGNGTGSIADFQQSNVVLGRAMNGLLGYSERYPEIQATQNFSDLQAQLEGTENRISVARKRFNEAVQGYNGKVRRFPGVFWASMFGFDQREYFESVEESKAAPSVTFDS